MSMLTKAEFQENLKREHELTRQRVWADAWTATANSNNCQRIVMPTEWADKCLEDFDERFKAAEMG